MSDDRTCENCLRTLDRGDIRQRDRKTGRLVCSVCLAHPIEQPNKIDVTATLTRKVAHDGGDGQVIYHCLGGETRFLTNQGVTTLEDSAGSTVVLLTAALGESVGRWVEAEVRDFGEQELFAVTLKRNKRTKVIRATAGHRWFVRRPDRVVTTEDLRPGHRLAHARHSVEGLRGTSDGIRAGLFFGDGTLQRREERTYGQITLWGAKADLVSYFQDLEGFTAATAVQTDNGVEGVRVSSGMAGWTKRLPSLSTTSLDDLYGWLQGYFAADGSVGKAGVPTLSSAVVENLEFVRDVCALLGIGTYGITTRVRKGYGQDETPIFQVALVASDLERGFFLRQDQADRWREQKHERFGWTVASVEPTGQVETVYCAVVPGTESFVLEDNILTGNCPFCGSGGVVARSDGSTECTVCQQYFTIQVQPRNRNSPQTVNGEPVHIPGMPEESEIAPVGGNNVPVPVDQQDAVVPGFSDPEMEEEEFLTATGARLSRQHYVQHLALTAAPVSARPRVEAMVRAANAQGATAEVYWVDHRPNGMSRNISYHSDADDAYDTAREVARGAALSFGIGGTATEVPGSRFEIWRNGEHVADVVARDVRTAANRRTAANLSAYCMRCTEDDLSWGMLCRRPDQVEIIDHGPDHDPDLARYEGICQRCCGHNHG